MWIDGQAVPLVRTVSTDGDLLKPAAGSKFDGKIEFREYFAARRDAGPPPANRRALLPRTTNTIMVVDSGGDYIYGDNPTSGDRILPATRPRGRALCDAVSHLGRYTQAGRRFVGLRSPDRSPNMGMTSTSVSGRAFPILSF